MKYNFTKTLSIACELDSSEVIMFNKGGRHEVILQTKEFYGDEVENQCPNFDFFDVVKITFQMSMDHQSRFDWITSEAQKHKESVQKDEN